MEKLNIVSKHIHQWAIQLMELVAKELNMELQNWLLEAQMDVLEFGILVKKLQLFH
jgi:hypothetical protein